MLIAFIILAKDDSGILISKVTVLNHSSNKFHRVYKEVSITEYFTF